MSGKKNSANDGSSPSWANEIESKIRGFAKTYGSLYSKKKRELAASFEIGCLHRVLEFYSEKYTITPENLEKGSYRYLTSPSGNPANFSWVSIRKGKFCYELRQQVRIKSHLDDDITFSPDIVLLRAGAGISNSKRDDYANGKRSFYQVSSFDVVAAHECKSLMPFPELFVSFIGMFIAGHAWNVPQLYPNHIRQKGSHLAPTLFVGGTPRGIHWKMIRALERKYPINIIAGLHNGFVRKSDEQYAPNFIWKPLTLLDDILMLDI